MRRCNCNHGGISTNPHAPVTIKETRHPHRPVSGRQPHDIPGHDVASPDFLPLGVAQHGSGRRHLLPQLLDGSPRLIGLGEIERGAEEDDDGNDRRVRSVSEKGGKEGSDQQDQHQRIQEKAQKVDNGRLVLGRDGIIGTKLAEPRLGFL